MYMYVQGGGLKFNLLMITLKFKQFVDKSEISIVSFNTASM